MTSAFQELEATANDDAATLATARAPAAVEDALSPGAAALPDSLLRIPVTVQVVLGSVRLPLAEVANLKSGSIVTLDQKLGTPVTILVNGKEVARGDLFVLDGEQDRLGVTITELAPSTSG